MSDNWFEELEQAEKEEEQRLYEEYIGGRNENTDTNTDGS